jgi:dihydroorotase
LNPHGKKNNLGLLSKEEYGGCSVTVHHPIQRKRTVFQSCCLGVKKTGVSFTFFIFRLPKEMIEPLRTKCSWKKSSIAEVCVHHLWFTNDDYATKGNFIKWNPAVKTY